MCTFEALIWNNSQICDVMLFIASLLVLMSNVCSSVTMFAIFVSSKFCTKHSYLLGFIYVCWLIFFSSGFHKFSECVCRSKASTEWPFENNLSTSTTSKSGNIAKVSDDARA